MKNFRKFFSIILIILCLSLFIYIIFRSQLTFEGKNNDYYNKYYYIIFFVFLFSLINFKLSDALSFKISAILISIILAFYAFEITLYFIQSSNKISVNILKDQNKLLQKKYSDYDIRTRLEVYLDEKKKDPNVAVLPVPLTLADQNEKNLLLLSGHSKIKTVFCNELGFYIIYKSDRYGFRNPNEEWNKEEIEYLIVGDSLAHGMCVNEIDTVSGWLRENLKNKSQNGVLNLAMWGNGPHIMYATLKEYLNLKKVKRVLWLHSQGNDFTDISFEKRSDILNNYLSDNQFSQNLAQRQDEIDKKVLNLIDNRQIEGQESDMFESKMTFQNIKQIIKLTRLRKLTLDKKFFKSRKQPLLENVSTYKEILIKAIELSDINNSKFYFVDLPDVWGRKYPEQTHLLWDEKVIATNQIKEFLQEKEVPYIDIYEKVFKNHNDVMSLFPYRGYGHFNGIGYKMTAEAIFNEIENIENN